MEFKKRYKSARPVASGSNRLPGNYAGKSLDKQAELVLCVDGKGECVGCAGVEGERYREMHIIYYHVNGIGVMVEYVYLQ